MIASCQCGRTGFEVAAVLRRFLDAHSNRKLSCSVCTGPWITSLSAQCQMQITQAFSAALILPHPSCFSPIHSFIYSLSLSQIRLQQRVQGHKETHTNNCNCNSNVSHRCCQFPALRNGLLCEHKHEAAIMNHSEQPSHSAAPATLPLHFLSLLVTLQRQRHADS